MRITVNEYIVYIIYLNLILFAFEPCVPVCVCLCIILLCAYYPRFANVRVLFARAQNR